MTSDYPPEPLSERGWFEQILHLCSTVAALAAALLSLIFLFDIFGRELFNKPFLGTNEIVANSMVIIFFMLLPSAIRAKAMIRVSIVYEAVNDRARRAIDAACDTIGLILFGLIAYAQWDPMIVSWRTSEYEGAGAFEVPVYPVRTVIVLLSGLCALVHAKLLYLNLFRRAA